MATSVIMPKAGMAMETGTIIQWFKKVGDPVTAGEPVLEIQTDKVAMEVEAEVSGYLIKILHEAGDEVAVTETIGYIGAKGEVPPGRAERVAGQAPASGKVMATPAARRRAAELGVSLDEATASGQAGEVRLRDVESLGAARGKATASAGIPAGVSPLARRIAEQKGLDPSTVSGTGPGGRIIRRDVEQALSGHQEEGVTRTPIAQARKIIAERMLQSHLSIPPVTLDTKADVTSLLQLRTRINGLKIGVNDLLLKATAVALVDAPFMLRTMDGDSILQFHDVNLGMAVALESGLLVPVIRGADRLTLSALARRAADLALRARERKLTPDELLGGTFTVTNLGMYGITSFTPIIDPPQGAILGVNAAGPEVYLEAGQPKERMVLTLSLTIDHRVIDGAQGALFLQKLVALLENPYRMLV